MSLLDKMAPSPRRAMTIFYLIDTSISMDGYKIAAVNKAMRSCKDLLQNVAYLNDDAEIKIAVLTFSDGCRWVTDGPMHLDEWEWSDLVAYGFTDFGAALSELNTRLSLNEYMESISGNYAPIILLFSDGYPTDEWEKPLIYIKRNNWFNHAIKIAVNIDKGSDINVLSSFTGSNKSIIESEDEGTLINIIQQISIVSSEYQSTSKRVGDEKADAIQDAERIVHKVKMAPAPLKSKPKTNIVRNNIGYKDFVVRRSSFKCFNKGHTTENIDAMLSVMPKNSDKVETRVIKIPAAYCHTCNTFFIMESTYDNLCTWAIPLCRISDEKTYYKNATSGGMQLAQESLLMQYGYNVSKTNNLSSGNRQGILAFLLDNKIMSKNDIISYLDFFVSQRKSQRKYIDAICKWEEDRDFVRNYKSGFYKQVWIDGIRF